MRASFEVGFLGLHECRGIPTPELVRAIAEFFRIPPEAKQEAS